MGIYLDYNASTPISETVLEAMVHAYRNYFGNADSRTHENGQIAHREVEKARVKVAALLGVSSNDVIFTSGATESTNIAILGLELYGIEANKKHILTTSIEHKAVLEALRHLEARGFEVEYVNPLENGRIDAASLLSRVRSDTLLVSVQHVNNETGIIQPIKEIGDGLLGTDVLFHVDAVQSCGKLVDEIKALHYDMMSIAAHKMYGPQGVGALILRKSTNGKRIPIRPITFGGGQEHGLRPGTLPVALIIGFGKACELLLDQYLDNLEKYKTNKQHLMEAIVESGVAYSVNGDQGFCMANTLNISFTRVDSEALMIAAKQYCSISNGSACTSHDYSLSYVLTAMGLPKERIETAIRLSWGTDLINKESLYALFEKILELQ